MTDDGPARIFNVHTGKTFEAMVHALDGPAGEIRVLDSPTEVPLLQATAEAFVRFGIELAGAGVRPNPRRLMRRPRTIAIAG